MENIEQNFQSASTYYNKDRKRSFLFSRIAVITSMLVLVVALMLNLSLLNSPERSDTRSQASTNALTQDDLPPLPDGCVYQQLKDGPVVVCSTPTPENAASASAATYTSCIPATAIGRTALICTDTNGQSVTVPLPSLPGGCTYQQTGETYSIACAANEATNLAL